MTRMWENRVNGASGVVRDTEPAGQGRGAVGAAGPPADRAPDRSAHGGDTGSAAGLGDRNGHSRCVLCGALHPRSWRLPFTPAADDRIRAEFVASEDLQGYDGLLHGGVIAVYADGDGMLAARIGHLEGAVVYTFGKIVQRLIERAQRRGGKIEIGHVLSLQAQAARP